MGNTLISNILFQPPTPPNPLPDDFGTDGGGGAVGGRSPHQLSVEYLWLYAQDECTGDWQLIPAIHVTHGDDSHGGDNAVASPPGLSPSSSSLTSPRRYTLLYSHGNAEDLGLISPFLADLARLLRVDVLCYDYSGYGLSAAEDSVESFYRAFGKEVQQWKLWREEARNNGNGEARGSTSAAGHTVRFSTAVFAAPLLPPSPPPTAEETAEDARHDAEDEDSGAWSVAHTYFTGDCGTDENTDRAAVGYDGGAADARRPTRRQLLARHAWTAPSPSDAACYANIAAAYGYLTDLAGVHPRHVLLYGKSVGSGPTCWLGQRLCRGASAWAGGCADLDVEEARRAAGEMMGYAADGGTDADERREPAEEDERAAAGWLEAQPPGGVVLHSPFLSVIRVVLDLGFTTVGDLFPNIDRVGDLT